MKKTILIAIACMLTMAVTAQPPKPQKGQKEKPEKFSPEKFQADMEQFIVSEACLTPSESAKFFPVYNEMRRKQRMVFDKIRRIERSNPTTDAACRKAIKESDNLNIELKEIQQTYHNKFMSILPPAKVFKALKAEDKFHHRMLKHEGGKGKDRGKGKPKR